MKTGSLFTFGEFSGKDFIWKKIQNDDDLNRNLKNSILWNRILAKEWGCSCYAIPANENLFKETLMKLLETINYVALQTGSLIAV